MAGTLTTAAIRAGGSGTMSVRNPWPGQQAQVLNGATGAVVAPTSASTLSVPVSSGSTYLVEQPANPTTSLPFAQVTGTAATSAKHFGVQIGLDAISGDGTGFPARSPWGRGTRRMTMCGRG